MNNVVSDDCGVVLHVFSVDGRRGAVSSYGAGGRQYHNRPGEEWEEQRVQARAAQRQAGAGRRQEERQGEAQGPGGQLGLRQAAQGGAGGERARKEDQQGEDAAARHRLHPGLAAAPGAGPELPDSRKRVSKRSSQSCEFR